MCGISGILGLTDAFAVDESTAVRMRDTLVHRGPDAEGVELLAGDRVALAHRRLAIVDLSPAGRQPMSNEDGTLWITYNGEIYNHAELRAELEAKGHRYRSRTDSETIVHLYEELGPDCVERLDGMFAFAVWDGRRRELFLARDRVGVKPLSFASLPGGFLFASEPKALLEHPALAPDLDEQALHHYLTFAFVPPPQSLFAGIEKLAPAERMTVSADDGSIAREIYWDPLSPELAQEMEGMSDAEMIDELRELLRGSIRKRMMSDVPYGVFLSGGLDSSTNVALMSELTPEPVRTYSTAPKSHAKYDELRYARTVAERFHTDHHEVLIDDSDLASFLPQLGELQDEPLSDWTSIPQHFVTKLARDSGTVVVQVGEGADEIFHGYKGYADHRRFVPPLQRLPEPVRRALGRAAAAITERTGHGVRHGEALYDAGHSRLPYWGGAICFRGPLKDRIVSHPGPRAYDVVERHWDAAARRYPKADLFQLMSYVELKQRLSELLLMRLDRIAMLSSVEGREPFLDYRLVEFALALPARMKHRDGQGKWILREAIRDALPSEILDRPKQGFGTPMVEWLRGPFGDQAHRRVSGSSLAERGLLDYDVVDSLFAAHKLGKADWSYQLWNLYNLSVWHDRWVAGIRDGGADRTPASTFS